MIVDIQKKLSELGYYAIQAYDSLKIIILKNAGIEYIPDNIYDPAIVVKNSIINALSVASTVLTSKAVITLPK